MEITSTAIPEVKVLKPRRFSDARGWFSETWNERRLAEAGIAAAFVQDNMAYSKNAGTIRGLHFQRPPAAQAKLVAVCRGAILDVAVDIRAGSPTFRRHVAVRLSDEGGEQIWLPIGFAHGYCTLVPDTLITYKVTNFYDPVLESGLYLDDPALGIAWPVKVGDAIVAEKDLLLPALAKMPPAFTYDGRP
jgi:dTDP-4-dehydrorhamnose 3,5-epimerase